MNSYVSTTCSKGLNGYYCLVIDIDMRSNLTKMYWKQVWQQNKNNMIRQTAMVISVSSCKKECSRAPKTNLNDENRTGESRDGTQRMVYNIKWQISSHVNA